MAIDRVPSQKIVKPAPVILRKNGIDSVFAKDNPEIVFTDQFGKVIADAAIGAFNTVIKTTGPGASGPSGPGQSGPSGPEVPVIDVPSLVDIEDVKIEEYLDPTTNTSKYKAFIKIRNSSINKANVAGVDARIYNSSGSTINTTGSGNASSGASGTNVSAYVSKVTWYKAVASYNPFSGIVVTAPTILTNAQYPSDGNGVPADTIDGVSTSIKTALAWRKTEAEALAAVQALYMGYIV